MSKHNEEPLLIPRVEADEPLAIYWDVIRAAEATQRALVRLHKSVEEAGMDDLQLHVYRAWEAAKGTVECVRNIPQPENITPPMEVPNP